MKTKGQVFMFTGALSITRREAQRLVEEKGGIPGASVNRSTDYLVVGSKPGSKLFRAQQLGTKILTEADFWGLMEPREEEVGQTKIMTEDQFLRLVEETSPSYWSKKNFKKVSEDLGITLLPPVECKFCGSTIPYSILPDHYYCWNCNQMSTWDTHNCSWVDPGLDLPTTPDGRVYLVCRLCGEFLSFRPSQVKEVEAARMARSHWYSIESVLRHPFWYYKLIPGLEPEPPKPEPWALHSVTEKGAYWRNELDGRLIFVSSVKLDKFSDFVVSVPSKSTETSAVPSGSLSSPSVP